MKVLVTGATGFIGHQVCQTFSAAGHEIYAVSATGRPRPDRPDSSPPINRYIMGAHLAIDLLEWAPEVIVHLAWEGIPVLSSEMCAKNVREQFQFFDRLCELPSVRHVVATGSCREYGDAHGPCLESAPILPTDAFGRAKDEIRTRLETLCTNLGIDITWLRVFYAYGPGQRVGSLVPALIRSLACGKPLRLGSPKAVHDFVHVEDVATAILCAAERQGVSGIFNVGTGRPTAVSDVAEIVKAVWAGSGFAQNLSANPPDASQHTGMWADPRHTSRSLEWSPTVDLVTGVTATVRWFAQHLQQDAEQEHWPPHLC